MVISSPTLGNPPEKTVWHIQYFPIEPCLAVIFRLNQHESAMIKQSPLAWNALETQIRPPFNDYSSVPIWRKSLSSLEVYLIPMIYHHSLSIQFLWFPNVTYCHMISWYFVKRNWIDIFWIFLTHIWGIPSFISRLHSASRCCAWSKKSERSRPCSGRRVVARVGAKTWAEKTGDSMGRLFFLLPAGRDNFMILDGFKWFEIIFAFGFDAKIMWFDRGFIGHIMGVDWECGTHWELNGDLLEISLPIAYFLRFFWGSIFYGFVWEWGINCHRTMGKTMRFCTRKRSCSHSYLGC